MPQQVLTVAEINEYIRSKMDSDEFLSAVAINGEISNYKVYPSGHHYFSLKDESAAIRCVMFRGNAMRLRFKPENGMKVIAMGNISVYPRDGAYQLYCSAMVPDGAGDLSVAFEQLKGRLAAEGLFAPEHKKMLPQYPDTIGIVTSAAGAAIHDILRILAKRFPLAKVRLFPVRVQGEDAPGEIASAIVFANRHQLADLLIVGRGGGSMEDLWAFNDETVARAIYSSEIPVISAVGHEPDVTISDYVADLRAATPSNAAELAVPDQSALRQHMDSMLTAMSTSVMRRLNAYRRHLNVISKSAVMQTPTKIILPHRNKLTLINTQLYASHAEFINSRKQRYISLAARLDAISPLKVLARGYTVMEKESGKIVRTVRDVINGETINIALHDGSVKAKITEIKESGL